MSENRVEFEIIARLDSIEKSLKGVEKSSEKTGKEVDKNIGKGLEDRTTRSFKAIGAAAAVAGAAIVAGLAFGLKKSIDAAIIQEEAVNDLNSALARTGQFSEAASLEMQKFASELQSVTKFGDEVILQNAALIQSLGKLSTDGLKQATTAAADLSAALGIDLRSASQLVGRAASGNVDMFARYGVVIQKGATDAETFANALRSINTQFGGAAASQANTFSGVMTQLKNAFGDLQEEIGKMVTNSPAIVVAIRFIKEAFEKLSKEIKILVDTGDPFKDILLGSINIAKFFANTLGREVELIINKFKIFGKLIGGVAAAMKAWIDGEWVKSGQIFQDVFSEVFDDTVKAFDFSGTSAAVAWLDGFHEAIENAPPIANTLKNNVIIPIEKTIEGISFDGLSDAWSATSNKIAITADSLVKILQSGLVTGIQSSFAAIGGALVKGENVFAAFGKSVLSAMGAMLIQFGSMMVTIGIGLSTVPMLFGLQGPAAVAAGLAAIVAGGALQALGGGGGAGPVGAANGTPGSSQGILSPIAPINALEDVEDQGPRTDVTVNIQGSVLGDKRTLGREIAEALNDAFGNDGIVIAKGAIG